MAGETRDAGSVGTSVTAAKLSEWRVEFQKVQEAWLKSRRLRGAELTLDRLFLDLHRMRSESREGAVGYLDNYWALVAFADGYSTARAYLSNSSTDPRWYAFEDWLLREGFAWGSLGWRGGIPQLAEKEGRAPAQLFFELLERFDREWPG